MALDFDRIPGRGCGHFARRDDSHDFVGRPPSSLRLGIHGDLPVVLLTALCVVLVRDQEEVGIELNLGFPKWGCDRRSVESELGGGSLCLTCAWQIDRLAI